MTDSHKITIQYVTGCPNRQLAEDRVREALRRLGGPDLVVDLQEIRDETEAQRSGFRGSPTILIDGVDEFAEPGGQVGLACRVYRSEARAEGAPSVEQLVAAIGGSRAERPDEV